MPEDHAQDPRRAGGFDHVERPMIVLIGGATGTGKSTVATEVAHRLGITRVSSTDFIRETMRALLSPLFMPAIHYSSFDAAPAADDGVEQDRLVNGFLAQCRHVCVGVDAAVSRAVTERWSMILEGVHLVPGVMATSYETAIVVPVILEVADPALHRQFFHVRDLATGGTRPVGRYVDRLDDIRQIQGCVVSRAHREGVAVVQNTDLQATVERVLDLVIGTHRTASAMHDDGPPSTSEIR